MVAQCIDHQSIQGKRARGSWVPGMLLLLSLSEQVFILPMKSKNFHAEAAY